MATAPTSYNPIAKGLSWLARQITNHMSFGAYFEPLIQLLLPQWRSDRLRSKVQAIRQESADMYSLIIRPNKHWQGFKAGQHVELTVEKDGTWLSRFFTISSSPAYFKKSGFIELTIQIQSKGQITPWLPKALAHNSVVNISEAQGDFCLSRYHQGLLMIAGGSGITPFRAMLQELALSRYSADSTTDKTLLYYARSSEHFLFKQELENFSQQLSSLQVHFIDSEQQGFLSAQHLEQFCPEYKTRAVYLCGPGKMITHGRNLLTSLSVKEQQLHYEFFGPEPIELAQKEGTNNILFERSNKKIQSNNQAPKTLLSLAEEANTQPVSGCRAGVCYQCICQKKSGVVFNTKTKQYSDTGQQDIQLCISVPVSDLVLEL